MFWRESTLFSLKYDHAGMHTLFEKAIKASKMLNIAVDFDIKVTTESEFDQVKWLVPNKPLESLLR